MRTREKDAKNERAVEPVREGSVGVRPAEVRRDSSFWGSSDWFDCYQTYKVVHSPQIQPARIELAVHQRACRRELALYLER